MNEHRVTIRTLPSGVQGLDRVLGGGLPEYSFNLIAGAPGTGKTTLSQQIMYANASAERPVLHFTVLGEPPLKMLRYQQQFDFFNPAKVGAVIQYRNLSEEVLAGDLGRVLESIVVEVERSGPEIVVVDSFRTMMTSAASRGGVVAAQSFLQELSLHLATWEVTSFLIGEYQEEEARADPVFTVADGIVWLSQVVDRNSTVRKLQVLKVRGQAPMPGLHTFRITEKGLRVFPRTDLQLDAPRRARRGGRLTTGVEGLDALLGGGIPAGDSVLFAGPSGSGKSVAGSHFVAAAARQGSTAVLAVFEESPEAYLARAASLGIDLTAMVDRGDLRVIYLRPLDLSADEALQEIQDAVKEIGADRLVIDSLSGFEIALAQTFRDEFRESLYRMVAALTSAGITVLMTVEVTEEFNSLRFSPHAISFLTDDLVLQRYVELEGQLLRVVAVIKMRGSDHSKEWRAYEITRAGMVIGEPLTDYRGIISGIPVPRNEPRAVPGLTETEANVLRNLERRGEATAGDLAALSPAVAEKDLQAALDRLVALNYALRQTTGKASVYRVAARTLMG